MYMIHAFCYLENISGTHMARIENRDSKGSCNKNESNKMAGTDDLWSVGETYFAYHYKSMYLMHKERSK